MFAVKLAICVSLFHLCLSNYMDLETLKSLQCFWRSFHKKELKVSDSNGWDNSHYSYYSIVSENYAHALRLADR